MGGGITINPMTKDKFVPYMQGAYPNYSVLGLYFKNLSDISALNSVWANVQESS